jgi:sucrose phosphorylase
MRRYLIQLSRTPTKMIRMDAFAYSTIKIGTNCFFLEPEVWQLLQWLQDYVSPFGVEILPEVHEHYSYHQKISAMDTGPTISRCPCWSCTPCIITPAGC